MNKKLSVSLFLITVLFLNVSRFSFSEEIKKENKNSDLKSVITNNISIKANLEMAETYSKKSEETNITFKRQRSENRASKSELSEKGFGFLIESSNRGYIKDFNLSGGFGIGYLTHNQYVVEKSSEEEEFFPLKASIPTYFSVKYNFNDNPGTISPYLKVDLGYSFNFGDSNKASETKKSIENGYFYAIGLGLETEKYIFEAVRRTFNYEIHNSNRNIFNSDSSYPKTSYSSSMYSFGVGYKFNY